MSDMTTLSVTLWEQIISHLPGKHLGSVRCVCQTSRQAVENYVQRVVITETSIDEAPDLSRWPNLQTIIITDNLKAPYPEMMSLGPQGMPFIVACGKTSWWQTEWLREWVAKEQQMRGATVGLLFCVTSMDSDEGNDISAEIEHALKIDDLPITYLGVWSHLEEGVPLERLTWNKVVPGLSNLEGLYVEFIEVQAEVLKCMTHLTKLRVLFEEACTSIIDAVQHMPRLKTLHLEPIAEDSLVPEVLFTLGKEVQELCILGSVSMLSLMDHHSWLAYVLDLFAKLPKLNTFFCIMRTDELFSGHVEKSAWVSVDHLQVVAMGEVYIAYDKENDRISGAFRTFKDAETADPVLSHQPRYPRLQMG